MPTSFEKLIERAEKASSDDRHSDALAAFEVALDKAEAPHQRSRAFDGMANAKFYLKEDRRAFELLDEAIALCLPLADSEQPAAFALARAWYDKGGMLAQLGKGPEALRALKLLIDRFADQAGAARERDENELQLRYTVVLAMNLRAAGLRKLERTPDAIACYDDMIRRFASVEEVAIEAEIARAMLHRAWLLSDLGRQDQEIDSYDALVARYGENHLLRVSHTIIDALTGKHQCYRDQEEYEKAIEACEEIIRRYEFDPGNNIAERVARTMIRRANYLNKLGSSEEELAAYDQVSQMYGHFKVPEVRLHAAKALMFKAVSLNDADQSAAEMECYEEVLRRFADDPNAEVRAVAADALIYKGMSLALQLLFRKVSESMGNHDSKIVDAGSVD